MAGMIRVAHVALQLETGGMERLLAEFARRADRSRFELRFIALGSRGPAASAIEAAGWPVEALGARAGVRPSIALRLAALLRAGRIDLAHTHNTKPLLYAAPAARIAGVRGLVHTRHGQRHGATSRQNTLFRLAARCADRIVCVSDDSRRLCASEGLPAERLRRIWNGIDDQRFAYAGPVGGGPAVFVGRLSPEKDVGTLLRATALIVAKQPRFRLLIAGDGPCGPELRLLAASLGIAGSVDFLGEVADVAALLPGASLFVLPSITEGLPLTVLEAMACGLPVVATRAGGTPEAVIDGETGLLVDLSNPQRLAEALLRVWSDQARARELGLAGRRRVEACFSAAKMVGEYESMYQDVLHPAEAVAA